jgi:hypothetical protein
MLAMHARKPFPYNKLKNKHHVEATHILEISIIIIYHGALILLVIKSHWQYHYIKEKHNRVN